jgi:hypothetical protein
MVMRLRKAGIDPADMVKAKPAKDADLAESDALAT